MPLTNAQRQKRWREKQKQKDIEKYRKSERDRKRTSYKSHALMSPAELKDARRKCLRKYRKRRACKETHEITSGTSRRRTRSDGPLIVKLPKGGKSKGVNKRYKRALRAAYRKIEILKEEKSELEKSKKRLQKRVERGVQKDNANDSSSSMADVSSLTSSDNEDQPSLPKVSTPRSKTKQLLKREGFKAGRRSKVRRQLIMGNAMIHSLRASLKRGKKKDENVINEQVAIEVVTKYRCIDSLSKELGIGREKLKKIRQKRLNKSSKEKYGDMVTAFLEREDNSTVLPGKNDTKKTGTEVKQKHVLNDYLHNLHEKFLLENATVKLSRSEFCKLRPPHILLTSFAARKTCLCTYHQNFALKIKAMRREGIRCSANADVFVKEYDTNEKLETVLQDELPESDIKYKHWRKELDGEKYRWKEREESIPKRDFISLVLKEVTEFRQHVHRVQNQYREVRRLRENLPQNEILLWMDFAENYTCSTVEEPQKAYWNKDSVSLHTMVAYFPDGNVKTIQSYVAISNVQTHNATAVYCILQKVMPLLKEECPNLVRIHYLTDSPTSQYRNKTIFQVLCDHEEDFGIAARWNYLEVGHGKGPCDGLGASVKRSADMAVKQEKCSIQDASDFISWAENGESKVKYIHYDEMDIEHAQEILNKKKHPLAVTGTMKLHAVVPINKRTIAIREVSCYCNSCLVDVTNTDCHGWEKRHVLKQSLEQRVESVETDLVGEDTSEPEAQAVLPVNVILDEWVAAVYDKQWYLGQVTDLDPDEALINFLTVSGKYGDTYKFPSSKDEIWIKKTAILMSVKTLTAIGRNKRNYKITYDEKKVIEERFRAQL